MSPTIVHYSQAAFLSVHKELWRLSSTYDKALGPSEVTKFQITFTPVYFIYQSFFFPCYSLTDKSNTFLHPELLTTM